MYYIPSKSDEVKNRALIYDPNTKKMFYAFIGYVPQIWNRHTNKYKIDNSGNFITYLRSRSNRNTNTSSIVKSIQKGVGKNET